MRKLLCLAAVTLVSLHVPLYAENFTLEGEMSSQIRFEIQKNVTVTPGVQTMTLSFVSPPSFQSPTFNQSIRNFKMIFSPAPSDEKKYTDRQGNDIISATWKNPQKAINARLTFDALNKTTFETLDTDAPFPLNNIPGDVTYYLKPTKQIQSENPRIRELAQKLTIEADTEFDAVQQILTWVVDNIRYVTPPKHYDALYSLESGKGNCQNYSHMAAALMRSVGIPVRIVNGVTLKKGFNIARKDSILTIKMGQGRHSWIEVWFPDLGWIPLDPQQTAMFVANRFIRVEVGRDNNEAVNDGRLRWTQSRGNDETPNTYETIGAEFSDDRVKIKGNRESYGPKNILLCPNVKAAFKKLALIKPSPPPVISDKEMAEQRFDVPFIFGNLEFPENIDFAFPPTRTVVKGEGNFEKTRDFYVETAEYVTTKLTQYAQVFVLRKPVKLRHIAMALHKFGGDGQLWVDLYKDGRGKPKDIIATSDMIDIETMSQRPGYRWTRFSFEKEDITLMPGSYWIGLGYTGSPIVNWFYTYGKPVGPNDGTRYKGVYESDWSGALSYEFNYRIAGLTVR
ncbi:MAG: transglutaminase domain-containing protein [Deltaproteobacteria bacterium]|nr:transglutaminase domain-containing protein [Deltaproteobacteria bacterium]